jgi:hypothetical protein
VDGSYLAFYGFLLERAIDKTVSLEFLNILVSELMDGSTLQRDSLSEYETTFSLGSSFRRKVISYIERCHLEDGGYFFARIPPSSGMDTYFAVKSLSMLGRKPKRPEAVVNFFLDQMREGSLGSLTSIFAAVAVINKLDQIRGDLRNYAQQRIMAVRNKAGGFGALENIDVEAASELEDTYRAIRILRLIGGEFDKVKVSSFVLNLLNPDGGFGREGLSTLASTFYATEIHRLLSVEIGTLSNITAYLRNEEDKWRVNFGKGHVNFIEHLFWLIKGLANMGEKSAVPDIVIRFVTDCQRPYGGFARTTIMGIPTLEYTYYAISILGEVLPHVVSVEIR